MAGLGILFIGMDMMSSAMLPLRESEQFVNLMTKFSNPALGILAGAVFTAVIQSSSASVGILQALASNGLIAFSSSVFVLFGQNIGTCITAVLAAIGTSRNAKRTTVIHLLFNLIGTAIFTIICLALPLTELVASFTPDAPAAQIANMHTLFNIVTSLLLLPFGEYLATAAEKILPESKHTTTQVRVSLLQDDFMNSFHQLGFSAIHLERLSKESDYMLSLAKANVGRCFQAILDGDVDLMEQCDNVEAEMEEKIDVMNKEIGQYISKVLVHDKTGNDIAALEEYFTITGNLERIGDHAVNISGYVDMMKKKQVVFSELAREEIGKMQELCEAAMGLLLDRSEDTAKWLSRIAAMEQQMDDMTVTYRENHLGRMRSGLCTEEG